MPRQEAVSGVDQAKALIKGIHREIGRRVVVGVSGYCGSGKSTLVRSIIAREPRMVRMRGDDFLDPSRSHHRSSDWDGVERRRLASEVLLPFREERGEMFRRRDFSRLWRDVWIPNEIDFDRKFSPRSQADVLYQA